MTFNDPALVATIAGLHDAYERALAANDVEALSAYFWDSPGVVRYGVAEELYGSAALRAFRESQAALFTDRRILRREIATFGSTSACVMAEIEMRVNGLVRRRQSQTWVQIPAAGWRIVSAHVSAPLAPAHVDVAWGEYADAAADVLGLPLGPDRPAVVANLERTAAIAAAFLSRPLPDETDPAPVFTA